MHVSCAGYISGVYVFRCGPVRLVTHFLRVIETASVTDDGAIAHLNCSGLVDSALAMSKVPDAYSHSKELLRLQPHSSLSYLCLAKVIAMSSSADAVKEVCIYVCAAS